MRERRLQSNVTGAQALNLLDHDFRNFQFAFAKR
jgi:hypothetical protein